MSFARIKQAQAADVYIAQLAKRSTAVTTPQPPVELTSDENAFFFVQIQASLSKYYRKHRSKGGKRAGEGRAGTSGGKGDVGVLTRVLDLARPVICALGPLMAHLQVRRVTVSPSAYH